eukprot:gnl/TRDRNA2_/TRDRNA2_152770_c0_seq1.p1 gnl/TRDRNA2_/TRDRNA2_152770_c0~~gnl/TRDRNA2_/TRDRNA2_152770_c0_seq1.p1  ORF type:complete len:104 (-),score=11.87 gnl/TRDRNA2_/TRDRNA2_152770_c0_seq1:78-389(-)
MESEPKRPTCDELSHFFTALEEGEQLHFMRQVARDSPRLLDLVAAEAVFNAPSVLSTRCHFCNREVRIEQAKTVQAGDVKISKQVDGSTPRPLEIEVGLHFNL